MKKKKFSSGGQTKSFGTFLYIFNGLKRDHERWQKTANSVTASDKMQQTQTVVLRVEGAKCNQRTSSDSSCNISQLQGYDDCPS